MPKFLIQGRYTADGVKGLLREGASGRRAALEEAIGRLGGTLESMYFAFGEDDTALIVDVPDSVSVAALGLTIKASGGVSSRTTPLLTVEEIDEATRKQVTFRAPGA